MATAAIIELADAVTADLNARQGGWSQSFVAERVYVPVVNFEDLDTLKVHVGFTGYRADMITRAPGDWAYDFDIAIGVQYRPSEKADASAKFDSLMLLTQQIAEHFQTNPRTIDGYFLTGVRIGTGGSAGPFSQLKIETLNMFLTAILLTFRTYE